MHVPPNRRADVSAFNFKQHLWKCLIAIVAGNAIYFLLLIPRLPPAAVHRPRHLDLGLVLDFWVCLVSFGITEIVFRLAAWGRRSR
jgi:hypothetical protein